MDDLIKALTILGKYTEARCPINCSHDLLYVDVRPEDVSQEDKDALDKLDFFVSEEFDGFGSFRFGSC